MYFLLIPYSNTPLAYFPQMHVKMILVNYLFQNIIIDMYMIERDLKTSTFPISNPKSAKMLHLDTIR